MNPFLIALFQRLETIQKRLLVPCSHEAPLDALLLHDLVEAERPNDDADAADDRTPGDEYLVEHTYTTSDIGGWSGVLKKED